MSKYKPVLQDVKPSKKPVLGKDIKDQLTWSFSFKYFNQTDYFGLGETDAKWFVSVIERLRDLGKEDIDTFIKDHRIKDANRYHKINWDATNIPIKRDEINWVDKIIIENEEDYPFFQFQVSKGLGRVIGFWKEDYSAFFIVLLDPKHNMQPSKYFNYKVDDTSILPCEYTSLLCDIDEIRGIKCSNIECDCRKKLDNLPTNLNRGRFVYFQLDEDFYNEFIQVTKNKSIREIIENGLIN